MIIRFKTQGAAIFHGEESVFGLVGEYIIPDNTTKKQIHEIDEKIQDALKEYSMANNEDFNDFDYEECIEKVFEVLQINYEYVKPAITIYL